ncbi:L-fucose-proton symporter [termite gut metagenome]|uniref:L-fucose-proton symporter n=1 Tax=termite gut metagenome TaxID=433724 RepID=A0A5J4RLZ1_9ZZZZ
MKKENTFAILLPIMVTFFTMGFVDMVGTATNYVKSDLNLTDTVANVFTTMVFFWFLIFAVPTGVLMNRIGRRRTVLISLVITIISLLIPIINYSYISMLISFSLLGIGNTLMQVSLNPLLSSIVSNERLASSLTLGQFVKAIASFVAPLIATGVALRFGDWKYLFPIFMVIAVMAIIWLGFSSIEEPKRDNNKDVTFGQCFGLLGNGVILLLFFGIMCHVGIDIGINVSAPRILIERLPHINDINDANYATSVYFLFHTAGCFTGTFLLTRFAAKKIFAISVGLMTIAIAGFFTFGNETALCVCIALTGFGNSNIFPIILSKAMLYIPDKRNEVTGLMMMGIFGGAILLFFMGLASDALSSQAGALLIIGGSILYLIFLSVKMKEKANSIA